MRVHGFGVSLRVIPDLTTARIHQGDTQLRVLRIMNILQIFIQEILDLLVPLFCDFIDAGTERIGLQHQILIGLPVVKLKIQYLACKCTEDQCKQCCDT